MQHDFFIERNRVRERVIRKKQHDFLIERNRVGEKVRRKCNMISLLKGIGLVSE